MHDTNIDVSQKTTRQRGIKVSEQLIQKIRTKKAKIAVIGLGHVGLPTAAIFAGEGYSVIGSDVKKEVVDAISSLKLVTHEPGLDELVKKVVKAGKLRAVKDNVLAAKQSDVVLICVQTPLAQGEKPDLRYLESACRDVAKGLVNGKLVVVVSTVPPGTVKNLVADTFEKVSGLRCNRDFKLAYSPERILPGNTLEEFVKNVRLVGGLDSQSAALTTELFKSVAKGQILVTSVANAELAKLAENTFRYVNIAFANELALFCEKMGADIMEVIRLANTHPRVNIHKPGPGVGGPCLTKDPQLLLHPNGRLPFKSKLISCSEELNDFMSQHTVELVVEALKNANKSIRNSCVAVLGVAYKAEVSDTTNSPAQKIIQRLMGLGAEVKVYDPFTDEDFGAKRAKNVKEAVKGADCIIVATDHKMFANLPFKELRALVNKNPAIVDGKRIIDFEKPKQEGFTYYGIGLGIT